MRHVVVMQQIAPEGFDVLFRAAVLEAHFVIHAGIVHESVETTESLDGFLNCCVAALGSREFGNDSLTYEEFAVQFSGSIGVAIHDYRNRALGHCSAYD